MNDNQSHHSARLNAMLKLQSLHKRSADDVKHTENVQNECKCFELSDDQLRSIMQKLDAGIDEGLDPQTAPKASVKMLPSYVRATPNGSERGDYLALDLGGTNFRVLLIRLEASKSDISSRIFRVPDHVQKGTGEALFDHIASCLARFLEEHQLKGGTRLPLGFTFSFPCKQEGLTQARLINWTKGFNASGVVGKDVVAMLREACKRRGDIDLDVAAVLNDTTGTMMACGFQEPTCGCGVICGTGTNACYMEKTDRILKMKSELAASKNEGLPNEMIVNTEWGAFGDDGALDFVRTKYDKWLDKTTINPGRQLFEKMISGMFLGELVRVVLERLARDGNLFNGVASAVSVPGSFPTKFVSEIAVELQQDEENQFLKTQQILEEIGCDLVTPTDCYNVAYVCTIISDRAAYLCAAGITTLIRRMNKPYVTVGVDGSVFRFHPTFMYLLESKIDDLLNEESLDVSFQLMLSEDGSGVGAALVAAVSTRLSQESSVSRLSKYQESLKPHSS
ncbi:hypothetical protein M3Y95_00288800 [Aphelenchoides besseyi]|nr:hypothetical protein M3Y95_00288800 [Aphelenchoides besseyi]